MTHQRRLRCIRAGGGLLAASAVSFLAPAVLAQTPPPCSSLSHVVYVAGSTAAKVFVAASAVDLLSESPPINVVYQGGGSCAGGVASQTETPTNIMGNGTTFSGSPESPTEATCQLDTAGQAVDIGVSDVYSTTCGSTFTLAAGVKDHPGGPIQAMTFTVLKDSAQQVISYDAAYLAFGFGTEAGGGVPWNDPSVFEIRGPGSGTQQMLATAIALDAAKWKGNQQSGAGAVVTALSGHTADKDKAIGILSTSDADKNRASLRILSYQHKDQTCGFTPDSDSTTAFDKANVRGGQYAIWGQMHFYSKDSNADAKKVLDIVTGKVAPSFDLIKMEAKAFVVPDCAMRVSRTSEIGPMSSYMPAKSCECKYIVEATGDTPSNCKACDKDADCTSPNATKCNYGYCEAQ